MRFTRSLVVGVAAALVLSACATGGNGGTTEGEASDLPAGVSLDENGGHVLERNDPVTGGNLRVGLEAPVEGLDPAGLVSGGSAPILRSIYDRLFVTDAAGNVNGNLGESLETEDQGATWTMTLKSGVTFHDGTPFNAAAVAAHITRVGAEGSRSAAARDARSMVKLEPVNETTLKITLAAPSMALPALFANAGPLGFIPSPTAVQKFGAQFLFNPVGAGPFKLVTFQSGGDTKLERNPNYHRKGLPYLDSIEFISATDTQSRLAAAVAGDIDLASSQSGADLRDAEQQGLLSLYEPSYTWFNLLFNLSKPPFDDVRFREAVIRGIDLDALNASVFDGLNEAMTGFFPKSSPFYIDTDWPSYDPKQAKDLIKDWSADTGLAPEFTLTTTSPPEFQKQAAIMQQMLKDVGITMTINVGDQPTMITEALSGNYNSQHRYVGIAPEGFQNLWNQFSSKSAANISHASNPELDKLLDEGRLLVDEDERRDQFEKIQEVLREWLPYMPQIKHTTGWYVGDKVGGFPGAQPGGNFPDFALLYIAD